jgi:hypothetical protein
VDLIPTFGSGVFFTAAAVGVYHFLSAQKVAQKGALAACLFVARMVVTGTDGTLIDRAIFCGVFRACCSFTGMK